MSEGADASGRDPETLQLYVEESLEGLQLIDRLLLDAERGAPAQNLMATLFRTVHTIKGTAGYLAYERTQSLAHTAEDLLSRLRDGKLVAKPEHFTCLLAVGERLRQMVENVRADGEEGEVEVAALVAELRALMATEPSVAAAPAPAPVPDVASSAAPLPTPTPTRVTQADVSALVASVLAKAATQNLSQTAASSPAGDPPAVSAAALAPTAAPPPATATAAAPPPKADDAEAAGKERHKTADPADGTVRVNVAVLDRLMNLIGELVLARNQIIQIAQVSQDAKISGQAAFQRLNVVTGELQEQVMKTRMQPVSRVFEKIPRMVRDVARVVGKKVNCEIEGNNTEIDKALVEAIRDPVMHIVRNALDHGIEPSEDRLRNNKPEWGTLHVRAAHKGGAVTIEIEDDGRGMDPANLRAHALRKGVITAAEAERMSDRDSLELVFRPGFSTAAAVTDIS